MNKIGFQNFRKFKHFQMIDYSGITFLVGPNNSGKSTLVKALLLFNNYIKSNDNSKFPFGNQILEEANIVTYGRAKFNQAVTNQIDFQFQFGDYLILMAITGDDDKDIAEVTFINIIDYSTGFQFEFDFLSQNLKVVLGRTTEKLSNNQEIIDKLDKELSIISKQIETSVLKKTSKDYIELISDKEKIEIKIRELLMDNITEYADISVLETPLNNDLTSLLKIMDDFVRINNNHYHATTALFQKEIEAHHSHSFENLKVFYDYGLIKIKDKIFDKVFNFLNGPQVEYLGANTQKQSALFGIRDKENSLAQVIHLYQQLNISIGELEHRFVLNWMKEFNVGEDFEINLFAGEAYEMLVISGSKKVHLADKGMGSIQVMALILKLSCIIKKRNLSTDRMNHNWHILPPTTVIIEEPELNLHPALQSKLADLFHFVHTEHKVNFIVETHSEYLIRKTQLIVKEMEYEVKPNENPFSVIYFDNELKQWRMEYRADGKFKNTFGKGFYDESNNLTFDLI
jgi:predicted ATP-dependent endonuclease of OLD family